jgi:hypothetical protein
MKIIKKNKRFLQETDSEANGAVIATVLIVVLLIIITIFYLYLRKKGFIDEKCRRKSPEITKKIIDENVTLIVRDTKIVVKRSLMTKVTGSMFH